MTALQVSLLLGALIGAGAALAVYQLVPSQPDLGDVARRLSPPRADPPATAPPPRPARTPRNASASGPNATCPPGCSGSCPRRDLAVLRMTRAQFYGKKVLYA